MKQVAWRGSFFSLGSCSRPRLPWSWSSETSPCRVWIVCMNLLSVCSMLHCPQDAVRISAPPASAPSWTIRKSASFWSSGSAGSGTQCAGRTCPAWGNVEIYICIHIYIYTCWPRNYPYHAIGCPCRRHTSWTPEPEQFERRRLLSTAAACSRAQWLCQTVLLASTFWQP